MTWSRAADTRPWAESISVTFSAVSGSPRAPARGLSASSFGWMLWRVLTNVARGLAMGAADVVPGVSGGTVALLLGMYDRLVGQIAQLSAAAGQVLRGRVRVGLAAVRRADWSFLVALLVGIAAAVVGLVEVVRWLIDEQPVGLSAAFFGLVAMTVVTTRREVSPWRGGLVVVAAGGGGGGVRCCWGCARAALRTRPRR